MDMDLLVLGFLNGMSLGMVLFLLSAGLSLIVGLMGILNLAHGALYMIGAYVGWTIAVQCRMNFWLSVLVGGAAAGIIGLVLERGFLRYLYKQVNEQVLLTFGFIYILSNLTQWVWGPIDRAPFTATALAGSFSIANRSFPIARLDIIAIGLMVAIGLWWLQEKTRVGAILRAGMDDKVTTMAQGINLPLVSTAFFVLGAMMAGCAGVIGAQMFGARIAMSIDILLLALFVLIVGGVGSVQGTLIASVLIGTTDAFGRILMPDFAMFTMYLVMIIILLVRPSGLLGREARGMETATPQPIVWQQQRQLVGFAPYIAGAIVLIVLPPFLSGYLQSLMTKILIFSIFAMSLNLIFGYTGLVSLGHAAYFGVGAYTVAALMLHYGINSLWIGAPLGILMAMLVAAIFGIIALRVSGNYFLLVTFALGQLLYSVAWRWRWLSSQGIRGIVDITRPDLGLPWFKWSYLNFYFFVFVIFVICFVLIHRIVESRFGYALRGIRESELRMRSLGYNTWLYKYIAFIIGGLFAGVAGVLFTYHNQLVYPAHLSITTSGLPLFMVIIGGAGTLSGPVIGAAAIVLLEFFSSTFTPERWPLILGGAFVASMMYARGGIGVYLSASLAKVLSRWKR